MIRSGAADLPLHNGKVPKWLSERMATLGLAITESILQEYGHKTFVRRMSDPLWFQSLGCVLGMDWHSSGITTSVMGALKSAINQHSNCLGIYICGGRGKHSLKTPEELIQVAEKTGLDGISLVRSSKLSAKVDNTTIQDGFQLYLHSFIVSNEGDWSVIQQGMNAMSGLARRYHWHSEGLISYIDEPHTGICGENKGQILNLTASAAKGTRNGILQIATHDTTQIMKEASRIIMPRHHDVRAKDINIKRLGSVLAIAHQTVPKDFEELLLIPGLGPRTLQSLVLVSEVIHGTPSRFQDPARYSFAHGGKDGHPFPVPIKVYDETIKIMETAVSNARIGNMDKQKALKRLHEQALKNERNFIPNENNFTKLLATEKRHSRFYGGRTVFDSVKSSRGQLNLFQ